MTVPKGSKRLLVFVALHRRSVDRGYTSGTLWPVGGGIRVAGNWWWMHWCLNHSRIQLLKADKHGLAMRHDVLIDQHVVSAWANRLIRIASPWGALEMISSGVDAIDLLPRRYDDWVLMERERDRRRLPHALEVLIGISSWLRDDLNEALSWKGSTGTIIRAGARRMLTPCCVMTRTAGRLRVAIVEVTK